MIAFNVKRTDRNFGELGRRLNFGGLLRCVGNVVPQHYSLTSDCLIKSHSKNVTPITVPKAALVSSEANNLYIEYIYC